MTLNSHLVRLVLLLFVLKVVYVIYGYIYLGMPSGFNFFSLIELFNKNDAGWYQNIVENGYPAINSIQELGGDHNGKNYGQSSWAFFPLYPLAIKILCILFSLNFNQAAFIFSLLLPILLVVISYHYFSKLSGDKDFGFFLNVFFLCFPYSIYIHFYYTESLYILLVLSCFYTLYLDKKVLFSLIFSLLVVVRPNAILCLIPLFFYMYELSNRNFKQNLILANLFLFMPGIATYLIYLCYQYLHTGSFLAFSLAQKGWGKQFVFPLITLFNGGNIERQIGSAISLIAILTSVVFTRRWPLSWKVYTWQNLILPLSAGSAISMGRYISPIFPIFYSACQFLVKREYKYIIVFLLLISQLILYGFWLSSHPLSY